MGEQLQAVPEDWSTALGVVAHPDDLEYGAASAIARWTGQGKHVAYCLATSGEAGIDGTPPEQAGPLREDEERTSAGIVGVDTVEFLGHPDGVVEYGLPLRRDIARSIRRNRPEVVVTGNYRESWPGGGLNQADHVAVGRAVVDAVRDAGNRWVFRELLDEGLEPWGGVSMVLVGGSPEPTHAVDVTEHFDLGLRSLRAHEAYLAGLGDGAMDATSEFLERIARAAGDQFGCRYAVSFELLRL